MAEEFDPIRLSELLSARICHDLAGPAGAIANGAELLADDDPALAREAGDLLAGSADQLAARLRFFRAAFGWEGGAPASAAEAAIIAQGFFKPLPGQAARLEIAFAPLRGEPGKPFLKLLLNMILLASEALPRGGRISVAGLQVTAQGKGARIEPSHSEAFDERADFSALTPRSAPAWLAARLAERLGGGLSVEMREDAVLFSASSKGGSEAWNI